MLIGGHMTKQTRRNPTFLRWSEHVAVSDVQDPLGLGLRGSARLASRLLFCITSITPRARYFSFIPWCIHDWQIRERGNSFAFGLHDAIALREKALTLGCIAYHEGNPCDGGALVGSEKAAKWFEKGQPEADLRRLHFAKNPAISAYFNSLVNLGIFETEDDKVVDSDEELDETELTFDKLELSPIGKQLAEQYDSLVGRLASVRNVSTLQRRCTVSSLSQWGKLGGLCELSDPDALDRKLLQDIFFARISLKGESNQVRRQSLLLIIELCRQLSKDNWILNEAAFASAVYFGEIVSEDGQKITISWPASLSDIAARWRMFYFHHYMSVALEGMFAWLVTHASQQGLAGVSVEELASRLNGVSVPKAMAELLEIKLSGSFGQLTPKDVLGQYIGSQELDAEASKLLDAALRPSASVSEDKLEDLIRNLTELQSPTGLAIPLLLLSTTLARFTRWEGTAIGNWIASASNDPYLDLLPPVLTKGLNRRFGQWWNCTWRELAEFVLSRYVLQQHQSMSYEKTKLGDRCLLQVDGRKIISNATYDKIGMGNPRFRSAVQILKDLGLLIKQKDGVTVLTKEGKALLQEELAKERSH